MVHLFDLCLWFGHVDTASALAMHGVEGCVLEDHHNLGPFCRDEYPLDPPCGCEGWDTCKYCCFAFPVEQGIWMEDWDVDFFDDYLDGPIGANAAAAEAAATPLTRAMLEICSCDMELPFSGSPKAMARLLDIAILTGNQKATINLAKRCQVRPLRRWVMVGCSWEATMAALWAGASFQDLMVKYSYEEVPFPQALFLSLELEEWQEIRHLLPKCHDLWRSRKLDNQFGRFFLEGPHGPDGGTTLSLDKIRAANDAGVDLQFVYINVWCQNYRTHAHATWATWDGDGERDSHATLLDMAIWYGQPDCAKACVGEGIELKGNETLAWHKDVLRGKNLRLNLRATLVTVLDVVPSEAQTAAAAAGCAWLKRLWKSEVSQKGIVLYQMMLKMFKGTSFPMVLVQEILTFSMPSPQIIDQLDLWAHVGDWMAAICGKPPPFVAHATMMGLGKVGLPLKNGNFGYLC